jgi:hypothetical protein
MPGYNPADDLPSRHITDLDTKQTGATCPVDGSLVTCVGTREDNWLVGRCPACSREVWADATLAYSVGRFEPPDTPPPGAPPEKE